MLERFLVPEKDRVYIKFENISEATTQIFKKMGLSNQDAELSTKVLLSIKSLNLSREKIFKILSAKSLISSVELFFNLITLYFIFIYKGYFFFNINRFKITPKINIIIVPEIIGFII